jgi:hypothetical protein
MSRLNNFFFFFLTMQGNFTLKGFCNKHTEQAPSSCLFFSLILVLIGLDAYFLIIFFQGSHISSQASENSPTSIPSPIHQCTKALLSTLKSNLWSRWAQASAMIVVLLSMHTACCTLARSPPRHHSGWLVVDTNLKACETPIHKLDAVLCLDAAMAAFISFSHTSQ